jgi:hypothetical protein
VVLGALAAQAASGATAPAGLRSAAARCELEARTNYDAIVARMSTGDFRAFQSAAQTLSSRAAACASLLNRTRAGASACGRTVVVRGLGHYRQGGDLMAGAAVAAVQAGNNTQVGLQQIVRGLAFARAAASEVAVGLEVLQGRRGCARGAAAPRGLKASTLRVLPGLAQQVAAMLIQAQGVIEPEDKIAFGLLVVHLDTGVPPPAGAAEGQITNLQNQNPGIQSWRLAGLRTFWVNHATGVDWSRYTFDAQRFLNAYQTYIQWKVNSLMNQRNQFLGGIVGSEEAWRSAVGSWRAWEQKWYTREQASIAEYDAWDRSFKAERILVDAEALVRRRTG